MAVIEGKILFRFAVLADTHLGPTDGVSPSPWKTNRLANARAQSLIAALNARKPAFVVHVGDMVHPIPAHPDYCPAAARFHEIFASLEAPLHLIPGNHDMGDKPTPWGPAPAVDEQSVAQYEKAFGRHFYGFDHEDAHFVFLNTQILNSGLPVEETQWKWLESDLSNCKKRRIFLFIHYPLYLRDPDEGEHADNLAQPARRRLLDLIRRYKVEAVFAGHVHNFFYDCDDTTEFYVSPSVTAVRHDYSELFSIPPDDEFGRNDVDKLGYFWVEVSETGHVAHFSRTYGHIPAEAIKNRIPVLHTKISREAPVGIDMRGAWADAVAIPITGALDEFSRKWVRNDYALAAIWEMGIGWLRVPMEDLIRGEARARMRILRCSGMRFSIFTYDLPSEAIEKSLRANRDCYDRLEVVLPGSAMVQSLGALGSLRTSIGKPTYLSLLRTSADSARHTGRYAHFIDCGFHPEDAGFLEGFRQMKMDEFVDGLVYRSRPNELPSALAPRIHEQCESMGLGVSLSVRMSGPNPAAFGDCAENTSALVRDALQAAYTTPRPFDVIFDTLTDVDRGYFPRHGLLDRHYNHTQVSRALIETHSRLNCAERPAE